MRVQIIAQLVGAFAFVLTFAAISITHLISTLPGALLVAGFIGFDVWLFFRVEF
jgi:hypothetical protein